ncbi:MAG: transposase [Caldimonas sp.]
MCRCGNEGHGGAVTLIQRFGSAANLNIHLHCLVLDGVYRCGADGAPAFVEAAAPTDGELHGLLLAIITRLMKMLTRQGVLIEEMGQTQLADPDADSEEARTLRPLQAAAITYRIAFGPRAGQRMLTLRGAMPREDLARQPLCADIDGFSLHAAVRVESNDRKRLEQLCRYITRPANVPDIAQSERRWRRRPIGGCGQTNASTAGAVPRNRSISVCRSGRRTGALDSCAQISTMRSCPPQDGWR